MKYNQIDINLGIDPQALAILHLLQDYDFHDKNEELYIRTRAWYNGREKGVALIITNSAHTLPYQIITFGEHRNSDSIFVDTWVTKDYINVPTVVDFTDEAYANRKSFGYGETGKAVNHIAKLIIKHSATPKTKKVKKSSKK